MSLFNSRSLKKGLLVGGCLCLGTASALAGAPEETPVSSIVAFPYTPGVSVYGLGGNDWTATGDAMVPLFGRPLNFTYVDPQIYYHSNPDSYTGSVGAGQRWLTDSAGILGAYVFGDYNHTNDGHSFWFVSPGIESLGRTFDFSLNGYIPVSSQRIDTGTEFADQAGDTSQVSFSGHTQFDELVNTFDATGWGIDGQIGARLPFRNSKIYLGGYYFSPKDSNDIGGGAIRAEVPINDYFNVVLSEAYDSEYHNTLKAGLTVWFGGRHTSYHFNGDLATRMVDPIQRNVVAVAGGSRTAQPVVSGTEDTGIIDTELTNISFFVPEATPSNSVDSSVSMSQGDGSYESPYVGMSQANVDDGNAQGNNNFYINSGTYNAEYNNSVNPDFIVLNNDQLYGRTSRFTEAATGSTRPVINFENGGFEVPAGDTNDSFTGLQLTGNDTGVNAGIFVNHDTSVDPNAADVTVSIDSTLVQSFGDGIDILNGDIANPAIGNATVNISNSTITNNSNIGFGGQLGNMAIGGIAAVNFGNQLTLNVSGSTISNNVVTGGKKGTDIGGGIAVENDKQANVLTLNVNTSTISSNKNSGGDTIQSAAGGIAAHNNGNVLTMNVTNSIITGNSIINSVADVAGGIAVENSAGNLTLNVFNTAVTDNNASTNGFDAAGGIAAVNLLNSLPSITLINVIGSNISDNSGASSSTGGGIALANYGGSATLNVTGSRVADNTGYDSYQAGGIAVENDEGGNTTVNVTGSRVADNIGYDDYMAGGIAVGNYDESTLTLNVLGSQVTHNESDAFAVAGGIAAINEQSSVENAENTVLTINVDHSNISLNEGYANQVAGGIAIANQTVNEDYAVAGAEPATPTAITDLNVTNSNVIKNYADDATVAGGIAVWNGLQGFTDTDSSSSSAEEDFPSVINMTIADSNIVNNVGHGDSVGGGIALYNTLGMLDLQVTDSTIAHNAGDGQEAAGGLALNNILSDATINVSNSSIVKNTGEATNVAGGIAVLDDGRLSGLGASVTVDDSIVAFNTGYAITAGGIALVNYNGNDVLTVNHSNIYRNDGDASGQAGGIVVYSDTGGKPSEEEENAPVTLGTQISINQSIIARNTGNAKYTGGIVLYNASGAATLDVSQSAVIRNEGAGIFAVVQPPKGEGYSQSTLVTVDQSLIAGNDVGVQAAGDVGVDITRSVIVHNDVGVEIGDDAQASIDQSIVAFNKTALVAAAGGTIDVVNPIYFSGTVDIDGTSTITFPGLTPTDGQNVVCVLGICS